MTGSLVVIERAVGSVVDLEDVKDHLRVDHGDDDAQIQALIMAAITEFEDPNLGWLGRSITQRGLELRLDGFSVCLGLRCGPLVDEDDADIEIAYDDVDGVEQILPRSSYRLLDAASASPRIMLQPGASWPATRAVPQCVRVRYTAGYPADDPRLAPFKAAVKLHVEMIYDGDVDRQDKLRATINALLQPYRVYTF
jgi:uncharacterized phiE125 gp8 family phage protein